MTARTRAAAIAVFIVLTAAITVAATRIFAPAKQPQAKVDRWEQVVSVEPGVDYVIVSNGFALTSTSVDYGDEYSLAGKAVTTTDGVLGGEVDSTMLWRFAKNKDTAPGSVYYADGDMYITHDELPLVRDTWRGEDYLRLDASQPLNKSRSSDYYSWQLIRHGDIFYLASVSGSADTYNLLYYSKYYGVFKYLNDYSDMTQRLFSVKLFRLVGGSEKNKLVTSINLSLVPPEAGEPALGAYIANDDNGYRVSSTDWSGEPAVFAGNTAYSATVTVKPCGGFELAKNVEVSVNGRPVKPNTVGGALTVTLSYPVTGEVALPDTSESADPNTLFITSDIHKYTDNLLAHLKLLRNAGIYPCTVSFAGDMYTGSGGYYFKGWRDYAKLVRGIITGVFPASQPVFTMGNHDWESLYDENFYDGVGDTCFPVIFGYSRVGAIYPGGDKSSPYVIFNIGATDVTYGEYYSMFRDEDLAKLRTFLKQTDGSGKLIIINSHWPLHYAFNSSDREVKNAENMIDLLNEYGGRNDILFVWGHNHNGDPSMLTARSTGDEIVCDKAGTISRTIRFTYANAGAMIKGTGLLVRFDDKKLQLNYYALPGDGSETLVDRGSYTITRVG